MTTSNEKYTLNIVPVGDHLRVHIPEIDVTVETAPGETRREDAERVGLAAISRYERQHYEAAQAQAKAS
jgi:hypothetical protein